MTRVSLHSTYNSDSACEPHILNVGSITKIYLRFSLPAVSEATVKQTAELMLSTGLADAGYKYIVIDGKKLLSVPLDPTTHCKMTPACSHCCLNFKNQSLQNASAKQQLTFMISLPCWCRCLV